MNHPINFFRFVFTIIIAFLHFRTISRTYLYSGYIVVEFFFIISGYFLCHTCLNKNIGAIKYLKERFRRFWLKSIIIGLLLTNYCVVIKSDFNKIVQHFLSILAMLQATIPFNDNIDAVYPLWYLSVLIYGGFIIYVIITNLHKQYTIILLSLIFVCYAYLFNTINIESNKLMTPFIRGFAGISVGCLLYNFINISRTKINTNLINLLSLTSVVVSTALLFQKNIHGIIPTICYIFIIIACFNKESILYRLLNKSIFSKWSAISFEVFIGHMIVIKIVFFISGYLLKNKSLHNLTICEISIISIIYIISLVIFAYIYQKVCNYIQGHIDKLLTNDTTA